MLSLKNIHIIILYTEVFFMKKLLISLLCLITVSIYPVSYNDLKSDFKEELYRRQKGMMGHKDYLKFIEEYLNEGEKTLIIPQECLKLSNAHVAQDYFKALVYLNIAILYDYVSSNTHNKGMLEKHKENVLTTIQNVKTALQLYMLDPKTELQKTLELFTRANKTYYKKLNFAKRGLLVITAKVKRKK